MALSASDVPTMYAVLVNSLSAEEAARRPAEAALAQYETRPGFFSCLLEIISARGLACREDIRLLATVYFKNRINRYWRHRRDSYGITNEEKDHLRKNLLLNIREENIQIALQLAVLISKIARLDYPEEWPDVFSVLAQQLQSADNLASHRVFMVLFRTLKELSTKQLAVDQKNYAELMHFCDNGSSPIIGCDVEASPMAGNGDNGPTSPARPLRLVYCDENGKLMMDPEAVAALQLVKGPIGVVSIFGQVGQGKSFVLNQLLGHNKAFQVASTYEPCTKGLWMWSTPLKRTAHDGVGCNIVLLDAEGIDAYEQTGNSSIPIFSLLVLLSSMLICNQMGGGRSIDALDCLSQVMEMTKHLRDRNFDASELGQFSPVFVWLLRDFCQDLTKDNRKMTPRDYLDLALGPVQDGGRDASAKNAIRESVRARFPDRECFTLVRPVSNEKDVRHLDQLAESKFRPEFRSGLDSLREFVLDRTSPILFGGSNMTGPMLAELTQSFLDAINSGTVPAISSSRQSVEDAECPRPDNSSFDRKRKLEELRLLKEELHEIHARNTRLRTLLAEKKVMVAKAKEESRLAVEVRKKAHRALQALCDTGLE